MGTGGVEDFVRMNPMYNGSSVTFADFDTSDMTWDYLDKIREDGASAVEAGADSVYVSNHGGRAEASGWGAIESLSEVVEKVLEMLDAELSMVMGQVGATSFRCWST